jgi:nicotinate-nucleotide adenylyltransferase
LNSGRRIGVFGGAFDPPHRAHLALAQRAVEQLRLDELRIFPTGQAWHKTRPLTRSEHRLAMTRLIFSGVPKVLVDEREMRRDGPTFTIDTLQALRAQEPDCTLFLVMGADQADALTRWHRWHDILAVAIICVAGRAQQESATAQFGLKNLEVSLPQGAAGPASIPEPSAVRSLPQGRFEALRFPPMAVSATETRQRIAAGMAIDDLVTEPVARYIALHHLYLPD